MEEGFKVTNEGKDPRQFWDKYSGRIVILLPGESVFVKRSPEPNECFTIEKAIKDSVEVEIEQPTEKKSKRKKKGDDE